MSGQQPTVGGNNETVAPGASIPLSQLFSFSPAAGDTIVGFDVAQETSNGGYLTDNGVRQASGYIYGNTTYGLPISEIGQWAFVAGPAGTTDTLGFNADEQDGTSNLPSAHAIVTSQATSPPPPPETFSVVASPDLVNETAGSLTFTITRSGGNLAAETVYASTLYGSTPFAQYATNTGDYATNINERPVFFGAGTASAQVTLQLGSTDTSGVNKTFGFEVQAAATTAFTPDLAETSFTIDENATASPPPPPPETFSVVASPDPVNETAGSLTFTIKRSGGNLAAETVYASTLYGSTPFAQYATNTGDYATNINELPVSFGAGTTSAQVTLQLGSTDTSGVNKTFGFEVQAAATTAFTPDLAETSFTIDENATASPPPPPPETFSVVASPDPVNETAGSLTFTIKRSGGNLAAETVYASTLYGSTPFAQYATNTGDYATNINELPVSFGAGTTSAQVTLQLGSTDTSGVNKTFGFEVQAAATTAFTPDLAETSFTIDENAT